MRNAGVVWSCVLFCVLSACGGEHGGGLVDGGDAGGGSADTLAPTVGAAVAFTDVGATSVTVTWGAASDEETATHALEYRLVRASASTAIDTLTEAEAVSGGDIVLDFTPNTLSADSAALLPSTTYAFAVIVQDASGNRALYAPAPVTTLPEPGPAVTISMPTGPTAITSAASIALAGTATDATSITSVVWVNSTSGTNGTATGTGSWSIASIPLAVGDNTIVVTATDATNHTGTAMIVVTRDVAGPALQIANPADNVVTAQSAIAVSGTSNDPAGVASVAWINTTNTASGAATGTTTWSVGAVTLANGSNTIEVTATDSVGNATTAAITVVRDSDAPTIAIDAAVV
jgi:large repetitive protein